MHTSMSLNISDIINSEMQLQKLNPLWHNEGKTGLRLTMYTYVIPAFHKNLQYRFFFIKKVGLVMWYLDLQKYKIIHYKCWPEAGF